MDISIHCYDNLLPSLKGLFLFEWQIYVEKRKREKEWETSIQMDTIARPEQIQMNEPSPGLYVYVEIF